MGAEGVVREGAGRAGLDLTEEEAALAELAATVARREIAPVAAAAWSAGRCPVEVLQKMGQAGLLGLLIPQEWGGSGATTVGFVAAMEQIGRADQSVAAAWQAHSTIGSLPLLRFGTDEQRDRWLRPLAEGRALGAFGLTEPEAGSDASAIRTRAVRRDDGWVTPAGACRSSCPCWPWGGSRSPRCRSAWPRPCWRWPRATRASGASSAGRSSRTRPSRSSSRTWRPNWRRPGCSPTARRHCGMPAARSGRRRRWPSSRRLHAGFRGGALLLRRQNPGDRRGHQRDPATGDRSRPALIRGE